MQCAVSSSLQQVAGFTVSVIRPTHRTAILQWTESRNANGYTVILRDMTSEPQAEWKCHVTKSTLQVRRCVEAGHTYMVTVKATQSYSQHESTDQQTIAEVSTTFRAEFTIDEQNELFRKATKFVKHDRGAAFNPVKFLYRNKTKEYFNDIENNQDGIMEVYIKDNNGDQASIINGAMDGLFFATHISRHTNMLPKRSNFGKRRLCIPVEAFFNDKRFRLYFADFYCIYVQHFVTLVLTYNGSEADRFCVEKKLKEVDLSNNDFLIQRSAEEVVVTKYLNVEVLYTENINIPHVLKNCGASFTTARSKRTSTPGGLPKNRRCKRCNLDPSPVDNDEVVQWTCSTDD